MALLAVAGCRAHAPPPTPYAPIEVLPIDQVSGTRALLQAVSAVDSNVVWVSGHRATWVRTIDGGATWQPGRMQGADSTLEFRDVHAVSAMTAYLLSSGKGDRSRIYKTTDGGATWQLQFTSRDTAAFYDCFDFWDADRGLAVSDEVNGRLVVITTADGGAHWNRVPDSALPPALPDEGAFAASGSCVVARGTSEAWIGTGNTSRNRVWHTKDRGRTWTISEAPLVAGSATGTAALAVADARTMFALGGRLSDSLDRSDSVAAVSHDGGATWTLAARPTFSGAVYGSAIAGSVLYAVGPKGLDYSTDQAMHWRGLRAGSYWSVGAIGNVAWAVGPGGKITKLVIVQHQP